MYPTQASAMTSFLMLLHDLWCCLARNFSLYKNKFNIAWLIITIYICQNFFARSCSVFIVVRLLVNLVWLVPTLHGVITSDLLQWQIEKGAFRMCNKTNRHLLHNLSRKLVTKRGQLLIQRWACWAIIGSFALNMAFVLSHLSLHAFNGFLLTRGQN